VKVKNKAVIVTQVMVRSGDTIF